MLLSLFTVPIFLHQTSVPAHCPVSDRLRLHNLQSCPSPVLDQKADKFDLQLKQMQLESSDELRLSMENVDGKSA